MSHQNQTRRTFIKSVATTGAVLPTVMPTLARAQSANSKVNIAGCGVQGKGASDLALTSKNNNVVALCDVDDNNLAKAGATYTKARQYNDWRIMLEQKDIDAVTVSTPDHMHAPVAITAMNLGKHVYVQKPLSHDVYEARIMRQVAKKNNVITQMGNQGHSSIGYRAVVDLVRSGVIGKIKAAHTWSNRPIWPQGVDRPKGSSPVPSNLHWDLWIGTAPMRPYVGAQEEAEGNPRNKKRSPRGVYNPFNWRGWFDFGAGALGDMGCHIIDPVFWALELDSPDSVKFTGPNSNGETYPTDSRIRYKFPGTQYTKNKTINVTWHDGGNKPSEKLAHLAEGQKLPDNGCLFIGEKGEILCPHGGGPQILPRELHVEYVKANGQKKYDAWDHYQIWTEAIKGNGKTNDDFDYAGPLTETVVMGNISVRYPDQELKWDGKAMKFTNAPDANKHVRRTYRKGWEVKGLS